MPRRLAIAPAAEPWRGPSTKKWAPCSGSGPGAERSMSGFDESRVAGYRQSGQPYGRAASPRIDTACAPAASETPSHAHPSAAPAASHALQLPLHITTFDSKDVDRPHRERCPESVAPATLTGTVQVLGDELVQYGRPGCSWPVPAVG